MTEREGRRGGDEATESSTGHDGLAGKRPRVQRRASTTPASSGSRLHPPDAALDRHDGTTRDDPFALHLAPRAATASEIATHAIERKDGGTAVDPGIAARTSATVGADVSNAKVHDDATSQAATAALGARAFAYGSDVFLGPGERCDDVELLAHELTHVSQQGAARPGVQTKTEAAVFTLASNLAFSKDHSIGALVGEFGKNLLLFGALRAVGLGVRAAGFGQMITAGSVAGATTSAKLGKTAAEVFEVVAMGEAGMFFAIVEGKIRAAMTDKPMTQEEVDELVKMTVIQTVVFAIIGRLARSPLRQLEWKGAAAGQKFKLARAEAKALEQLAGTLQGSTDADATMALLARDRAQIQREIEVYNDLLAEGAKNPKLLKDAGLTQAGLKQQIKALEGFATNAKNIEIAMAMNRRSIRPRARGPGPSSPRTAAAPSSSRR